MERSRTQFPVNSDRFYIDSLLIEGRFFKQLFQIDFRIDSGRFVIDFRLIFGRISGSIPIDFDVFSADCWM